MPTPQAGIPWQLYCMRDPGTVSEGLPDAGRGGDRRGVSCCSACRTPAPAAEYYRQRAMVVLEPAAGMCGRAAELAERAASLAAEAGCAASRLEEEEEEASPTAIIRAAAAAASSSAIRATATAAASPRPDSALSSAAADAAAAAHKGQGRGGAQGSIPSEQQAAAAVRDRRREARVGAARLAGEAAGLLRRAASAMETALSPGNRLLGGTLHRAGRAALLQARCLRAAAAVDGLDVSNSSGSRTPTTIPETDGLTAASAAAAAAISAAAEEAAGSFEKSIAVLQLTSTTGSSSSLQVASEQLLLLEALALGAVSGCIQQQWPQEKALALGADWEGGRQGPSNEEARREGVRRAAWEAAVLRERVMKVAGEGAQRVLGLHFGAEAAQELIRRIG